MTTLTSSAHSGEIGRPENVLLRCSLTRPYVLSYKGELIRKDEGYKLSGGLGEHTLWDLCFVYMCF